MGCGCSSASVAPSGPGGTGREQGVSDDEHRKNNIVLKEVNEPGNTLKIEDANLQFTKNREEHHTDEYEQKYLILRRGQTFQFAITFDRKINIQNDKIIVQFTCGSRPQESKRSIIRIPLNLDGDGKSSDTSTTWTCSSTIPDSTQVTVDITSPPDCAIGFYSLFIETREKELQNKFSRFEIKNWRIAFIFNPWCKDDVVYMEEDDKRNEYVLNEQGKIWRSMSIWQSPKTWNFGQFSYPCLDVALYLLDQNKLNEVGKANVISVVRAISARANSIDNDGILVGNWSGKYDDGTRPTSWAGSVKILEEYFKTKTSVKYGQCWVFSGIATTLCRALGIPARSITNFDSAHDTDASMTIDFHVSEEDGKSVDYLNDSVWNFHVWNEAWFLRNDLPANYGGWQVFDATPQESSEGVYRCGPAPVKAIKEGQVYMNYDTKFIFAEVNGDKVYWTWKSDGSTEVMSIDKGAVGKYISTKAVGSNDREDVTLHYKYEDGSQEEKRVTEYANRYSSRKNVYKSSKPPEIGVTMDYPYNTLTLSDFKFKVSIKNLSDGHGKVTGTVTLVNSYYVGTTGKTVKEEPFEKQIASKKEAEIIVEVAKEDYIKNMAEDGRFTIYVTGKNETTGRRFASQGKFELKIPDITIEAPETAVVGKDTRVTVKFKNPFSVTLTHAVIHYEGASLIKSGSKKVKDIKPGDEIVEYITMHPENMSYLRKSLSVSLSTAQVSGIDGDVSVRLVRE